MKGCRIQIKRLLIFLFVCSLGFPAFAQEDNIDSLLQLLKNPLPDTARISIRNQLINDYYKFYPDSAIRVAQENFRMASEVNFTRGISHSLIHLGRSYLQKGEYFQALDYLLRSLNYTDYYDAPKIIAVTYWEIGKVYAQLHNILHTDGIAQNILTYNKKAISLLDNQPIDAEGDIPVIKADAQLEIGRAYMQMDPSNKIYLDSASYYFRQALAGFEQVNMLLLVATIHQDFALLFERKKEYDSALMMAYQLRTLLKSQQDQLWMPSAYNLIARLHMSMGTYDSAHVYADMAINQQLASNNKQFLANSYEVKAGAFLNEGKFPQAIKFFKKELDLSQQQGNYLGQEVAYNSMVTCYKNLADYRNAFLCLDKVTQMRDSISLKQDAVKMENLQALFDSSQKQKQMEVLSKQFEINEILLKRNRLIAFAIGIFLVISIAVILLIIRQYRLIQKSKQEQARLFSEMDQMKSRFFANISHEFRTPLTLMLTPLERRIEQAQTQHDKEEWLMIQKNGNRLLSLVNQLLDLSKIEAGKMALQLELIELAEWMKPLVGQFASIAESRNINFQASLQPDFYWAIDREKMEQVILNLLSNAFKFTPNGGTIDVSLVRQQSLAHITILDSGIGIPAEQVPHVFDRFYQVDDSHLREYEGTGIGLALARELVGLHGGTITVSSEHGKGSSFNVTLPDHADVKRVSKQEPSPTQPVADVNSLEPELEELESDARACVLIVEDNSDLRKYIATELGKTYRILSATHGLEGLEKAQQIPDLIISDLMMPKMDGLELCRQIKTEEKTSHIPVILLTAKVDQQVKTEGLQTGADDYIAKPFHLTELLVRVQNLIESRKRLRRLFSAQISLRPSDIQGQSMDDRFIKKVLEAIESNISNSGFGVEPLANAVAMSSVQVYRKLKAITGKTPNEVIREVRLERAATMLQQRLGTVAEIAYQVGFNNLSYFSKCFKIKFGSSPSDFNKLN